jgi:hypothetical protein
MDEKIKEYRTKNQKCKWCKYYKYESPSTKNPWIGCPDYEMCILKDKIIHFTNKRNLCLYYELKKERI